MQQLITLAEEYFDNVEIVSAGSFKHNKFNSTEHFLEASDEAELLIVCTNNDLSVRINAVKRQYKIHH